MMRIYEEFRSAHGAREEIPNFHDISEDQQVLTQGQQWKTLWFYAYGVRADELRTMSGDRASLAEDPGNEVGDVLDSCAQETYSSASWSEQGRAKVPPRIDCTG